MWQKQLLLLALSLVLLVSGCTRKKYALLCPGEKPSLYKPLTDKQRDRIEKNPILTVQASSANEMEAQPTVVHPKTIQQKPIHQSYIPISPQDTITAKAYTTVDGEPTPDSQYKELHQGSVIAACIFYIGIILGPLSIVGWFWAIRNLFYLRHRKDQYSGKGLSLVVVYSGLVLFGVIFLIWLIVWFAFAGAELVGPALIFLSIMWLFFLLAIAALMFYYGEVEFFGATPTKDSAPK